MQRSNPREAQWPIGKGKAQHQEFAILKHGEEAKRKALAARRAVLNALATQTFPSLKAPV